MGFWHISSIHAQNRAFDHFCRKQRQLADVCDQTAHFEEKARNRLKRTFPVQNRKIRFKTTVYGILPHFEYTCVKSCF